MSDETTMLPCPFCGGEAETLTAESMYGGYLFSIMCNDCLSHGYVYDTEAEAIVAWNTRTHGTLTAEQIGAAIERNFTKICVLDDGKPVEWREDWVCRVGIDYKAIADDLNATLGSGECDAILDESYYKGIHGYCEGLKCSNCGEPLFSEFKSCPWCGMTIRKAVKQ